MMTTTDLADRLCKDVVRGVYERGERSFIVTNFTYPVGDSVNLYLSEENDGPWISDRGSTHYMLRVGGVEFTQPRKDIIHAVCVQHRVQFSNNALSRKLSS